MPTGVRGLLALSLATFWVAAHSGAAPAAQTEDGTLTLAGTVVIPTFPCPPPSPDDYPCVGTLTGSTAGALHGVHGASPWHISLNATTTGTFSYADDIQPGVPCTEGRARGTASLNTETDGQAFGTYHSGVLVRGVRNVAIDYSFSWVREGVTSVVTIFDATITLEVDGLGDVTVMTGAQAFGVYSFVPSVDSGPPSGCVGGPPTELRGSIIGEGGGLAVKP